MNFISGFLKRRLTDGQLKGRIMMAAEETIAAISTGLTDSGIGIIRISGKDAVSVGNSVFRSPSGKKILKDAESHKFFYGYIVDAEVPEWKDHIVDEVMAVVMRAPRSFTGEDVVELQCHGGVFVMKKILGLVTKNGARLAQPGEFTKRAFLNGRMDLSRAEAVMDVIQSQNEYALSVSMNQLKGKLSEEIRQLRAEMLYEIAFIESALDDPEHISLEGYSEKLSVKINQFIQRIQKLLSTADNGRLIKEGISTVIVGKPNAGKSSVLNLLLGEERAIVTDIAGTTRDALRETITLGGIYFHMVDTAGIRSTDDAIEKIGVERAKKYAEAADLIIYVVDSSVALDDNDREIIKIIGDKKCIVLLNKSDLPAVITEEDLNVAFHHVAIVKTSAKNQTGLEEFEKTVKDMFFSGVIKSSNETVITNMRHKEALQEALQSLELVRKSMENGMPEDFFSIDLMDAYMMLGRIIGEELDDDLVNEIFGKFCMGK